MNDLFFRCGPLAATIRISQCQNNRKTRRRFPNETPTPLACKKCETALAVDEGQVETLTMDEVMTGKGAA